MPRIRKSNPLGLPARVYWRNGAFRYLDRHGHWHTLGRAWDAAAKRKWVEITAEAPIVGTVSEMVNDYIEKFARWKRASRTYEDHKVERIPLLAVFGKMRPEDVEQRDIAKYLEQRGAIANTRANREISLLSSAFSYGLRQQYPGVRTNPCYGVRRNTEYHRTRSPSLTELRVFNKHAPDWLRCYVLLKYMTGLRQGDMLKLPRLADTERYLDVVTGKTGAKLCFRVTRSLRIVIEAVKRIERPFKSTYLFTTRDGSPMKARAFKSAWQRAMQTYIHAGGEHFTEHDVRASNAGKGDLKEAQQRLGHASEKQTRDYRRAPVKVRPIR